MPPEVITETSKTILDVGVVGAICLLLMALLVYRERYWQGREKVLTDGYKLEIASERGAHDKTREALLEEVRSNGDTIALVRQQMQTQQAAFETLMRMRKEAA